LYESNSNVVSIREANSLEHKRLSEIAIRAKAYWGYSAEFMEMARAELMVSKEDMCRKAFHYCVAELPKGVCGFYSVASLSTEYCRLDALFVEPQSIGKGIGRSLVEHAKDYAQSTGAKFMFIQSDPHAASFYIAAGGVKVGETESGSIKSRFLPEFRVSLHSQLSTKQ